MGSSSGVRSLEHTPLNAYLFYACPQNSGTNVQDLVVWRKAHELVLAVYSFTAAFPKEETYGLTLQMRRAAVSVPANIAEGFRRRGKADKARYMNMAEASLEESRYYLILAQNLGSVTPAVSQLHSSKSAAYSTPMQRPFWLRTPDFHIPKGYQGRSPCLVRPPGRKGNRTCH